MRKRLFTLAVMTLVLVAVVLGGTGCAKKVAPPPPPPAPAPPPPPPPPPPAPTISLTASPSTIQRGQSTTLTWSAQNASEVSISGGIGTVEASGNRTISPTESTTYTARATGKGGSTNAETRVTVTEPPPPPPPAPRPISDGEFFESRIKDAYFDYDKYNIRDDARTALQGDAAAFSERATIKFTIEGHCDERGSEKYNLALGDRRANAAKDFLTSQGVNADRIETISYGKEQNVCSEHNEDCWQKNRRAHFKIKP